MHATETLNEGLKRAYIVTIPASEIESRVAGELKRVAPQVRMPGFRPGKVPVNLVRKMHGPAVTQDVVGQTVRESVEKTLADNQLRPAIEPKVELAKEYVPGHDVELTVELETLPDMGEPKVDGIVLERLTAPVTDAEVDEAVATLAGRQKSWDDAPKSRKAKDGDQIVMDFVGKVDGVPFDGGTGSDMSVVIGSGNLIPGFEDQLIGVKAGDEKTIDVTFPDDYGAANLKGKPATFDLTITTVQVAKDTVADDEFATSLGLESLDKLKELLRSNVEQEHNGLTRTHMKRKLLDRLAETHDFPVPPTMLEQEFDQIWAQLEHEAGHDDDPDAAKAEMENERDDYRGIAERRVRLGLLLSEIGRRQNIEVSQTEMQAIVAQAAQQYPSEQRQQFAQFISQNQMAAAQLRAPLYEDKVVDWLFSTAQVNDRAVDLAALRAAIEEEPGEADDKPKAKEKTKGEPNDASSDEQSAENATEAIEETPASKPAPRRLSSRAKVGAAGESVTAANGANAAKSKKAAKPTKAEAAANSDASAEELDTPDVAKKPRPRSRKPKIDEES